MGERGKQRHVKEFIERIYHKDIFIKEELKSQTAHGEGQLLSTKAASPSHP